MMKELLNYIHGLNGGSQKEKLSQGYKLFINQFISILDKSLNTLLSLSLNSWNKWFSCFNHPPPSSRNNTVSLPGSGGLFEKKFSINEIMKSQRNKTANEESP